MSIESTKSPKGGFLATAASWATAIVIYLALFVGCVMVPKLIAKAIYFLSN